jgi:chromate reductase
MRILGIAGSLRCGSHNLALLWAAAAELPPTAAFHQLAGLDAIPAFDEDIEARTTPPAVRSLRDAIATADALVIATPEYNRSVPGALKNALDWASRPFSDNCLRGKPVCVIGASTGLFGATWAQAEVRKILDVIGADVIDQDLPVGRADEAFDQKGRLADPNLDERLRKLVTTLIARAESRSVSHRAA